MNVNRRSSASARRRAEARRAEEQVATPLSEAKPLIDSITTRATPCPLDPPETEETLP